MKETDIPGKRRGRYIPKFYVFRGFHLSTCYPWVHPPLPITFTCSRRDGVFPIHAHILIASAFHFFGI